MQGGGGNERRGEAMKLGRTGVVIVVVRTGGTDRVRVAIDEEKERVPGDEKEEAHGPAQFRDELGQQAEEGDPEQNAGAQRDHDTGALPQTRQPQSEYGAGHADGGG